MYGRTVLARWRTRALLSAPSFPENKDSRRGGRCADRSFRDVSVCAEPVTSSQAGRGQAACASCLPESTIADEAAMSSGRVQVRVRVRVRVQPWVRPC